MNNMWYDDYEKYDELYELDRHDLIHIIYDLEKTLDKLCNVLEDSHLCLGASDDCHASGLSCYDCWKKWSFEDE